MINNDTLPSGIYRLKKRLLFIFCSLVIYRIGTHIPVPCIDPNKLALFFNDSKTNIFSLLNLFSGGALSRFSIFSLGVMPYISASIIVQLMSAILPFMEQLKKEGYLGKQKMSQYVRYLTLIFSIFQSLGMAQFMVGFSITSGFMYYSLVNLTLVTGTMFLMWLGEQMTENGIGNGISLIIFAGIVSNIPQSLSNFLEKIKIGELNFLGTFFLFFMFLFVIYFVVFIEKAQRKISVNYAKVFSGRKSFISQQKTHLPFKINMSGVIPPIFASSLILFPATLTQWFSSDFVKNSYFLSILEKFLTPGQLIYIFLYGILIAFFCFFYTSLIFNSKDTANNLKKSGGFLSGIRPGDQTASYIDKIVNRLTFIGAIYIVFVSLLPEFLILFFNIPFYFGGTSLLIIVVVVIDFISQIQTKLMSHQYEGLMKKARFKGFK